MAPSASNRQMIRQIRSNYKDPAIKKPSFLNDDAVIKFAVEKLYEELRH